MEIALGVIAGCSAGSFFMLIGIFIQLDEIIGAMRASVIGIEKIGRLLEDDDEQGEV